MKYLLEDSILNSVVGGVIVATFEYVRLTKSATYTPNETAFRHLLGAALQNDHGLDAVMTMPAPGINLGYIITPGTIIDGGA